jgi:hypothetical protein
MKGENRVRVFYDTERREKDKDSTYTQRIIRENFDAFATLSYSETRHLATTGYATVNLTCTFIVTTQFRFFTFSHFCFYTYIRLFV